MIPFENLIIADSTADLNNTSLVDLLPEKDTTAFILPLYSRNDEEFINAFMRKLHAEKGEATVYVFGLPQWLTFSRLNPDYMENTNVHVSAVHFMDPTDTTVYLFERQFLSQYGTIPEPAAFQGYTFMRYLGQSLYHYGTDFLEAISGLPDGYGVYNIQPVFRSKDAERRNPINYYENRAVEILEFTDHAFHRVE